MQMRRLLTTLLAAVVTVAGIAPDTAAQTESAADGAASLGLALRRLGTTKRVLMIGAHPDDENTAVLSELALGDGATVAYLSLTRGEGGQNLIGPELQEPLGIIRSEELLAARRLDGAQQFFTRAYDYGFSKNAEEAFRQWPRDSLLADVVAVVRRFRPDVIVAVFSGTPRDGHGQHQASGIMAQEAFAAAGDPARFPDQLRAGLSTHQPAALYQALYRGEPAESITLETGDLDPLLGRSRYQIAMASRSRHRSQDMGRAEPVGPQRSVLIPVAGAASTAGSLFAGVDTTLSDLARAAGQPNDVVATLERYEGEVAGLRAAFNPFRSFELAPRIASLAGTLRRLEAALGEDATELRFRLASERDDALDALHRSAGLVFDATVDDARVVPEQTYTMTVTLWNGGSEEIGVGSVEPRLPDGWRATPLDDAASTLAARAVLHRRFRVDVPHNAEPTEPYYLREQRTGEMYAWPADPEIRGLPFAPPDVNARASVTVAGEPVPLEVEATFSAVDKAVGERRIPVLVVPALSVTVEPRQLLVPLSTDAATSNGDADPARELTVAVTSEVPGGIEATVRVAAPPGWAVEPDVAPVRFEREGEMQIVVFHARPPAGLEPGRYPLRVRAETDGRSYERGYQLVDYPHTRLHALYHTAVADVSAFEVAIAPDLTIGYIEGAGDDGAEALRQLGATVEQVDAATLATGDLSRYDVIVAGIRAYEVRSDLIARNRRLLDYARSGGHVVIQYNKYEYTEGDFAPYPLTMARPHGRVTDENAPVRLLALDHPLLAWPNRITESDFDGWLHERGLYFADTWDDRYTPLLAMSDPGEDPLEGSLLVADVGDGTYVYTGLALFRQLPHGVPGAYRILANLVSLGSAPDR